MRLQLTLYVALISGDRSEPVSAEVSFYSRGGSVPASLKAQITATYVTNTGELYHAACQYSAPDRWAIETKRSLLEKRGYF